MEVWRKIKGFENYEVSNLGNVKSLARKVKRGKSYLTVKEKILKAGIDSSGYFMVVLMKNLKLNTKRIHKLVAIEFLNHKPCGYKLVINHKDFNRLNNNVENLEIVTSRENTNKNHLKSSSQYTGVSWDKNANKWIVRIKVKDKYKYLGLFTDELKASECYYSELLNLK